MTNYQAGLFNVVPLQLKGEGWLYFINLHGQKSPHMECPLPKNEHVHPWHKREGNFPWSLPEFPCFVQKLLPRIATGPSHKHMLATPSHCQNIWSEKCI